MLNFLKRHFLTGLLALTPLAITVWILWQFYLLVSNVMRPLLQRIPTISETYPDFLLTLMGLVSFILAIILVGIFTRNLIGVAFFRLVEQVATRIPIVKSVFTAVKQIAEVLLQDRRTAFKRVVLFEYPRRGLFSMGFVTNDDPAFEMITIFLPTTPNPTSGYMLMAPRADVRELPIPVEEAIKLIVSGGSILTADQAVAIGDGMGEIGSKSAIEEETGS